MSKAHFAWGIAGACALALTTTAFAQTSETTPPTTVEQSAAPAAAAEQAPPSAMDQAAPADQSETPPSNATTAAAPADTATTATVEGSTATSSIVGAPPEGQGRIVFFRPSRFVGSALSFSVREGDTGIGRLPNGTYFVHDTEPGIHEYNIQSEATDSLRLEVEPGETYYVQETIAMGVWVGRPVLAPADQALFEARPLRVSTQQGVDRRRRNSDSPEH